MTQLTADPGEQGSIEWLMARVGRVTASNFKHVMDVLKNGKPSAKREGYLYDVVIERLTGKPTERYVNDAMLHGTEMEPLARMAYEARTGSIVTEVGLIHHPTLEGVSGSPDGLLDDDGIIEIKAPTSRTHIETMLSGECEHQAQIQGLLWILGRQYCDFISFDNRLPEPLQMHIQRVERDDAYIETLSAGVIAFLAEVQAMVDRLKSRKEPQ